jgi:hypothetical protein
MPSYSELQDLIDAHSRQMTERRKRAVQFFEEIARLCRKHGFPDDNVWWQSISSGTSGTEFNSVEEAMEQRGPRCWRVMIVLNIVGHGDSPGQFTAGIPLRLEFEDSGGAILYTDVGETLAKLNELPGSNKHALEESASFVIAQAVERLKDAPLVD